MRTDRPRLNIDTRLDDVTYCGSFPWGNGTVRGNGVV